jgi:hypothetical protein
MREAIDIFSRAANNQNLVKVPIMLVLNRVDVLRRVLNEKPLADHFPNYTGKGSLPT